MKDTITIGTAISPGIGKPIDPQFTDGRDE